MLIVIFRCDVPRTPHRRTQELPGTGCSRTAPRQPNGLNSSIIGIGETYYDYCWNCFIPKKSCFHRWILLRIIEKEEHWIKVKNFDPQLEVHWMAVNQTVPSITLWPVVKCCVWLEAQPEDGIRSSGSLDLRQPRTWTEFIPKDRFGLGIPEQQVVGSHWRCHQICRRTSSINHHVKLYDELPVY